MHDEYLVWSYLWGFLLFLVIGLWFSRTSDGGSGKRGPTRDRLILVLVNLSTIFLPLLYASSSILNEVDYSLPFYLGLAGVLGLVIALAIKWKGHHDLGRNFTTAPGPKGALVTDGIYAHVRHPLYLSLLIWGIATPLVIQNLIAGLVPFVFICLFIAIRVPIEERMLLDKFGDEYRRYKSRTRAILPRWKD